MKFFLLSIIIFPLFVFADQYYSFRVAYGVASDNDFGQIISAQPGSTSKNLSVVAFDGGYLLERNVLDIPVDIYVKGGVSFFNEDTHNDVCEAITYIKVFYNFGILNHGVRFGFGEGVSYVSSVLEVEHDEAFLQNENTSKFLNYLDVTLDVDIGKLFHYEPMNGVFMGYLIKHRSGVFRLYNNVAHGGSNYNSFYIEKNF